MRTEVKHTGMERAFRKLLEYAGKFDPVKLLSQLIFTHLVVPEDTSISEDYDPSRWIPRIEFLAGALLTREFPSDCDSGVTAQALKHVTELLDAYCRCVERTCFPNPSGSDSNPDQVLRWVRGHALFVRGDMYPHQYYDMARGIYGPHEAWFRSTLGFTIDEVITAVEALSEEYCRRITVLKYAEALVKEPDLAGDAEELSKAQAVYRSSMNRPDELLAFTLEELSTLSGLPEQTCIRILERLSQEWGYRNPRFANTFCDPNTAPWDYNTLYERPFIRRGEKYWMILPSMIQTVVLTTFYFDLMQDASYRPTFEKTRGRWLELKTAEYLRRVFDDEEVLLNPLYPDGNELADVLVLHGRKLLIVQCKSKGLTFQARMGADLQQLKTDLDKAVGTAFSQGVRARKYLLDTPRPVLKLKDRELCIDPSQVDDMFIINVTAALLQNLTTRWASVNPQLGLFTEGDYPWSLSLADLDALTEVLSTPAYFLHFTTRRLEIEHVSPKVFGDEMDFLGFYLAQGLNFKSPQFEKMSSVALDNMSHMIDEYMHKKHGLGDSVPKPSVSTPPGFGELIRGVEASGAAYSVDVAMALLDLDYEGQRAFVKKVDVMKRRTERDHQLHDSSLVIPELKRGLSFISMEAGGDQDLLLCRLVGLALSLWERHEQDCSEWFGLGWDISTDKVVDVTFFRRKRT